MSLKLSLASFSFGFLYLRTFWHWFLLLCNFWLSHANAYYFSIFFSRFPKSHMRMMDFGFSSPRVSSRDRQRAQSCERTNRKNDLVSFGLNEDFFGFNDIFNNMRKMMADMNHSLVSKHYLWIFKKNYFHFYFLTFFFFFKTKL